MGIKSPFAVELDVLFDAIAFRPCPLGVPPRRPLSVVFGSGASIGENTGRLKIDPSIRRRRR